MFSCFLVRGHQKWGFWSRVSFWSRRNEYLFSLWHPWVIVWKSWKWDFRRQEGCQEFVRKIEVFWKVVFLTSQTEIHDWVGGQDQNENAFLGFFSEVVLKNQVVRFLKEIWNSERKFRKTLHCPAFTYFRGSLGWALNLKYAVFGDFRKKAILCKVNFSGFWSILWFSRSSKIVHRNVIFVQKHVVRHFQKSKINVSVCLFTAHGFKTRSGTFSVL